jgi:hypothetical protein
LSAPAQPQSAPPLPTAADKADKDRASAEKDKTAAEKDKVVAAADKDKTPNVYINGLPPNFPEDQLFALAKPFGDVRRSVVVLPVFLFSLFLFLSIA